MPVGRLSSTASLKTGPCCSTPSSVCELTFCLWVVLVASCRGESGRRGDPVEEQWLEDLV